MVGTPTQRRARLRRARLGLASVALLCAVLLAACGDDDDGGLLVSAAAPSPSPVVRPLLAPPAPADGVQITMDGFDVPVGGETEVCRLVRLPNERPIDIDRFEVAMPDGSHHFVVWSYNGVQADEFPDGLFYAPACIVPRPADSMNTAMLAGSGSPRSSVQYPAGTGLKLGPHHPVLLNAHYVNATGAAFQPTVYVNLYYAKQPVTHPVEALAATNYNIFVPPGQWRTTTARWRVPFDMYFLSLSSHMHKRGDVFTARIVEGHVEHPEGDVHAESRPARTARHLSDGGEPADTGSGDFYRAEDWEKPTIITYDPPRLYPKGTVIEFSCTQHNDKSVPLAFGPLADDEMCVLTGTYYRADSAPAPGARIPGCLPQAAQLTCFADPLASSSAGPAVCGNGRREGGEECDGGPANSTGRCAATCRLELPTGTELGTRRFPIVFSGPNSGTTDFFNSVVNASSVEARLGVVADGALLFTAGAADETGAVPVSQDADVRIGFGLQGGTGSFCARIGPSSGGTLHCRGGVGVDLTAEVDNADGTATPADMTVRFGRGVDGGPGSLSMFLSASLTTVPGPPADCLTRDWSGDPTYPLPFTTGTSTGTITSADRVVGSNLVMSRTGENFDCSRWTDTDGPGILQALPFLNPNNTQGISGDLIALLTLAGHDARALLPPPTPTPPVTPIGGELAAITEDIFAARCALPSCHSSATRAGDLVLEAAGVYDALVGQPAANPVARAGGVLRVAPGAPATSYLMRKILGDLGSGEGVRMPLGNPPLPEHEVARIRAWILAGAPAQ